jgi:hypothetical protein
LRVLDEHDDGAVFDPPLLNVEFVDVKWDGYKDIFLCGCLKHTGNKDGDASSRRRAPSPSATTTGVTPQP